MKAATLKDTLKKTIGYIPIGRRKEGLATDLTVSANINMLVLEQFKISGLFNPLKERENSRKWASEIRLKAPTLPARCANLSGGNQ